jgi:hypothetical protein
MLLMVGAFALYQQLRFMQQQDLGFASETGGGGEDARPTTVRSCSGKAP